MPGQLNRSISAMRSRPVCLSRQFGRGSVERSYSAKVISPALMGHDVFDLPCFVNNDIERQN